jgi:Fe-S-cluster containining protein
MCGECCRKYLIPVNSGDIRRITEFTGLEPVRFLELIVPDESVASTYDGVPRIALKVENSNILVLKEENDACLFLKNKKCSIYQARPLRCRPFPFNYDKKRGEVSFQVNEDAVEFCKGLGRETKHVDFRELTETANAMEKEQKVFRRRVRIWNSDRLRDKGVDGSVDDLLKFLLLQ